jgi:type VI secretion system protein ImpH
MAAAGGADHPGLGAILLEEGARFDFYQAVRLLQRGRPDAAPVGEGDDPRREAVRFASEVALTFPPSEIREITPPPAERPDAPARMTVRFMGVATPASFGSLPVPYAELVLSRLRDRDAALRDFLDLFNHRLVSLLYRAWEKHRFAIAYERARPSVFERALLALIGMGIPGARGRLPCPDRALLARPWAFRRGRVSAAALRDLLEDYFGAPVEIAQFVPGWFVVEEEERSRLGARACELGVNLTLGEHVQVAQSRFRIKVGPLGWDAFQDCLPPGTAFRPLVELVRLAAGPEFDFDVQLALRADSVPRLRLGVADAEGAPWLGWSTWLAAEERPGDQAAEVIIDATAA